MFAVNHCTITPVRSQPSEASEQLTQLLFGEVCEVLETLPRWTKIRSTLDGQEGWVDFKMLTPIPSHLITLSPYHLSHCYCHFDGGWSGADAYYGYSIA